MSADGPPSPSAPDAAQRPPAAAPHTAPLRYKGLDSYADTPEDAARFGGRQEEIDALLSLVEHERCTILYGLSGTGKSSLLRAGLFPALRADGLLPLPVRLVLSEQGGDAGREVRAQIARNLQERGVLAAPPGEDRSLWEYFHATAFWSAENQLLTPVLVFDQFEEVFTHQRRGSAQAAGPLAFIYNELAYLVEDKVPEALHREIVRGTRPPFPFDPDEPSVRVLISLREDSLGDLIDLKRLMPSIGTSRLRLRPLSRAQAVEAVLKPAEDVMDEAMAVAIVEFVGRTAARRVHGDEPWGDPGVEAPLLSLFCQRLERLKGVRPRFEMSLLEDERSQDFVADFYDESVADQRPLVRHWIEESLLTSDGRYREMRSLDSAAQEQVTPKELDSLVERRLLRVIPGSGTSYVELIHDCLVDVVRERRERSRRLEAEERARREEADRQALARAEEEERLRLKEEVLERQRERERDRAASEIAFERRRRRIIVAITVPAVVVSALLAVWAWVSKGRAEDAKGVAKAAEDRALIEKGVADEQRLDAVAKGQMAAQKSAEADEATRLADRRRVEAERAQEEQELAVQSTLKLLLAQVSGSRAQDRWVDAEVQAARALRLRDEPSTRSTLLDILTVSPVQWTSKEAGVGSTVAVLPRGMVVAGDEEGFCTGWVPVQSAGIDFRLASGLERVRVLAVDEAGGRLAVSDGADKVSILRLGLRGVPVTLEEAGVEGLAFHRSAQGELQLWVISTDRVRLLGVPRGSEVTSTELGAWDRTPGTIACFGDDCSAVVEVEPRSGLLTWLGAPVRGATDHVKVPDSTTRGRLSRDGKRLAVVAENGVRICDLQTGRTLRDCPHQGGVRTLSFDAQGARLLTLERPGTAHVWEVGKPSSAPPVLRHAEVDDVFGAAWDGNRVGLRLRDRVRVLSLEREGRTRLVSSLGSAAWRAGSGSDLVETRAIGWQAGPGDRALTSEDGQVLVHDLASRRSWPGSNLPAVSAAVHAVPLEGGWFCVASDGRLLRTWDGMGVEEVVAPPGMAAPRALASARAGNTLVVLDTQEGCYVRDAAHWQRLDWKDVGEVRALALNATGTIVAIGRADGGVVLQDLRGASRPILTLAGRGEPVEALAFGERDRLLGAAFGGAAPRLVVWNLVEDMVCAQAELPSSGDEGVVPVALHFGERDRALLLLDSRARVWELEADALLALAGTVGHVVERVSERLADRVQAVDTVRAAPTGLSQRYLEAAIAGRVEEVKQCLALGVDRDVGTENGNTALMLAVEKGQAEVVRFLLGFGVDVNSQTREGFTALQAGAVKGRAALCGLLLDHGSEVGVRDWEGDSALHFASMEGHDAVAAVLLSRGAEVLQRNAKEQTALMIAARAGTLRAMPTLVEASRTAGGLDLSDREGSTVLHHAVERGDEAEVAHLIAAAARLDGRDRQGRQALHVALSQGAAAVVRQLLAAGAPVNDPDARGSAPLLLALSGSLPEPSVLGALLDRGASVAAVDREGDGVLSLAVLGKWPVESVVLLIEAGAPLDKPNKDGWLPIHYAAQRGRLDVVRRLLAAGSPLDAADSEGWTALHKAVRADHYDVAQLLLDRGADPNLADKEGWTALHKAIGEPDAFALMLARREDVKVGLADSTGLTELHKAAFLGLTELVKVLVERGVPLNGADKEGRTPILCALDGTHVEIVRYLAEQKGVDLEARAKSGWNLLLRAVSVAEDLALWLIDEQKVLLDAADGKGLTALHRAAALGRDALVSALLGRKVNVEAEDEDGWTPLFFAVDRDEVTTAALLLKGLSRLDHASKDGVLPLHIAAVKGSVEMARLLIDAKAQVDAAKPDGWNAAFYALDHSHEDVALLLLKAGANPKARTRQGFSLLHLAAHANSLQVIDLLLKAGVDIEAQDEDGLTALHIAVMRDSPEGVEALLLAGADRNHQDKEKRRPADIAKDPKIKRLLEGEGPR